MTIFDHLRLIWPQRPFVSIGEDIVFDDGQPMPTEAELNETEALAQQLWLAETEQPLPPITARQLRLWLAGAGILGQVDGLIAAMPEPQKTLVGIEWEYGTIYERTHPPVIQLGTAIGLTPADLDSAWRAASEL